jgi:hypothetical protein
MAFCQNGFYLTKEDYKNGKITPAEGIPHFKAHNKGWEIFVNKNLVYKQGDQLWGYRMEYDGVNTDYRIIENKDHAISVKGAVYIYSGSNDYFFKDKAGEIEFMKNDRTYPYGSRGIDGPVVLLATNKQFFDFMEMTKDDIRDLHCAAGYFEQIAMCYNEKMKLEEDTKKAEPSKTH